MAGWALSVDFGTYNTVAVLRSPTGQLSELLFDGSSLLPSTVYAQSDGTLLTGRDAVHSAQLEPHRCEFNPKLRVDEGSVLLGAEISVVDLFGAVLSRVAAEARRVATDLSDVVLTHPAGWAGPRRAILQQAAIGAGWPQARLLPEPVAAARYYRSRHAAQTAIAPHTPVVVYDLGGGTLDVAVVADEEVLASDGLPDAGGLDVDVAILAHLRGAFGERAPAGWRRLDHPESLADRRARRTLAESVRIAKEMLSRTTQAIVPIPLLDVDAMLGREQLDVIAAPLIERTVRATRAVVTAAGLSVPPPGPVYLTGGATRMPLVASMLHRQLQVAPLLADQPELVVARGALLGDGEAAAASPAAIGPMGADADAARGKPGRPTALTNKPMLAGLVAAVAAVVVLSVVLLVTLPGHTGSPDGSASASPSASLLGDSAVSLCSVDADADAVGFCDSMDSTYGEDVDSRWNPGQEYPGDMDDLELRDNGLQGDNGAKLAPWNGSSLPDSPHACSSAKGWSALIPADRLTGGTQLCLLSSEERYGYLTITHIESNDSGLIKIDLHWTLWAKADD